MTASRHRFWRQTRFAPLRSRSAFDWNLVKDSDSIIFVIAFLTYPDTTAVDYVYDLVGKITQVNDPTGTYAFAYDNMGRLIGTTTSYSFLSGRNFTTAYTYDTGSNRTGFTDPESGFDHLFL